MRSAILRLSVAVVAVVTMSACGGDDGPSEAENTATAEGIAAQVEELDGVEDVNAVYQDNATAPGSLVFSVRVADGVDRDAVRDEAMQLIRQSTINPLDRLRFSVGSGTDAGGYTSYYNGRLSSEDIDALTAEFGDRP